MPSAITTTRQALVEAVNTLVSDSVTVVQHCVPVINREDIRGTEIHVSVDSRSTVLVSRQTKRSTFEAWLMIISPLGIGAQNEGTVADDLHVVADSLIDGLLGAMLSTNLTVTKAEQVIATSPDHWREFRQCASFLKLTVEGV